MPYNNFGFNPAYGMGLNNYQAQPQSTGLTQVTGLEGAKAYQTPLNSTVPLFDSDDAVFYVKTTDNMGNSTVRTFDFQERKSVEPAYVTQEEFNTLDNKLNLLLEAINGKSVVSQTSKDTNTDSDEFGNESIQSATPSRRRKPASGV